MGYYDKCIKDVSYWGRCNCDNCLRRAGRDGEYERRLDFNRRFSGRGTYDPDIRYEMFDSSDYLPGERPRHSHASRNSSVCSECGSSMCVCFP